MGGRARRRETFGRFRRFRRMTQSDDPSTALVLAALKCADVGVWWLDPKSGQIGWCGVGAHILGQPSARPASMPLEGLLQMLMPEDRAAARAFFCPEQEHEEKCASVEVRKADAGRGGVRWLLFSGCLLASDAAPERLRGGIVRDISDRKQAELHLRDSWKRLNSLVDNLHGAIYRSEAAPPWRMLFISKGVEEIIGYGVEELPPGHWTWGEMFQAEDLSDAVREVEQAIAERRPFSLSYRLMHRSGTVRWVRERGEAVYDENGQPLFLEGFIADISDLVRSQTVLRQSKELLEAILEGIPDGVFLKNYGDEGRYTMANTAWAQTVGKSVPDILGRTDHQLVPPEEAAEYIRQDRQIIDKGAPGVLTEQVINTAQGQRLLEVRKLPLRMHHKEGNRYVLGIVRDRTEQRALEAKVQKMQRMDAVGQLTGGIAHDFNNLLAIILGYGELLRESIDNPALVGLTDKIIEATERGGDLVRRLLVFARKQRLEPHALNLNEWLPGVVALLQRTLGENIHIELALSPDVWPVRADPGQIDDALVNLSINARDAMPEGGRLTITTENVRLDPAAASRMLGAEPGEYVMLAVSDTGQGMTPEVLARVFEPFFTTKGRGTGLGLPMVYGFVEQSGGHVDIDSAPGLGTTVKLYLPRAPAEAMAEEAAPLAPDVAGGDEAILLVEDNDSVRAMALMQLHKLGYRVTEAANAAEALKLIEQGVAVDLLFTDIVMPGGMSGYQLAEQARRIRPDLPVLFTTGYDNPAKGNLPGPPPDGDLLYKPYRRHELAHAVRKALDQGRGIRAGE